MDQNGGKQSGFYSQKLKAGKRRTYFFDVKNTRQGDYFITITESKKRYDGEGYESHKIFLYKEDFKKFMDGLQDAVNHVKTELLPDYDYDADRSYKQDHDEPTHEHQQPEAGHTEPEHEFKSGNVISDEEQMEW